MTRNNFDLVRFVLSMMVCLVHCAELSRSPELAILPRLLSSSMAVQAFFVASGFLVFMSFDNSSSLKRYAQKRVRRLFPGYAVVVLGFAVSLVLVSSSPANYFGADWLKYVAANLVFLNFLHPDLPGVFASNPVHAVNGALWSLKVEVGFYFVVPVMACFMRYGRVAVLISFYSLSLIWSEAMVVLGRQGGSAYVELAHQLPGSLSFFVAGAAIYCWRERFERHIAPLLVLAGGVLVLNEFLPLSVLYPAALAIVVCFCALFCHVGNFGRYGDFSYGLYILHFPILQLLVASGIFRGSPWLGVGIEVALALGGSVLLWHFVEKRFLLRSSHYVKATQVAEPAGAVVEASVP